MTASAIWH